MQVIRSALGWAFLIGTIGFLAGFIGPIIFMPDANQGPLFGILISGPLSFLIGLVYGAARGLARHT